MVRNTQSTLVFRSQGDHLWTYDPSLESRGGVLQQSSWDRCLMKPDWWEWSLDGFSGNKQTLYTDVKTFRQHKTNDTKHPLELQLHWKLCSDLATIESGANSPTSKDNGWDHHYRCEVGRTQNKLFSISSPPASNWSNYHEDTIDWHMTF